MMQIITFDSPEDLERKLAELERAHGFSQEYEPSAQERELLLQANREAEGVMSMLGRPDWTDRQAAAHFAMVRPFLIIAHALKHHGSAIESADLEQIQSTFNFLNIVVMNLYSESLEFRQTQAKALSRKQKAGRRARGAERTRSHVWDEICHDFATMMDEGRRRSAVIASLSERYKINRGSLNRGLLRRGFGSQKKKPLP